MGRLSEGQARELMHKVTEGSKSSVHHAASDYGSGIGIGIIPAIAAGVSSRRDWFSSASEPMHPCGRWRERPLGEPLWHGRDQTRQRRIRRAKGSSDRRILAAGWSGSWGVDALARVSSRPTLPRKSTRLRRLRTRSQNSRTPPTYVISVDGTAERLSQALKKRRFGCPGEN